MTALEDLKSGVATVVATYLEGYSPRKVDHEKIIRDPVIGFAQLERHEIPIVDSPIVQRLRRIRQTALAYQVYPGANHSRFEHSIGVAHRAEQVAIALNLRNKDLLSQSRIRELRLAGLLHDLGHGPFSHLSESIFMEHFSAKLEAIRSEDPRFYKKKIGEILSFLIVTSEPFVEFADVEFAAHGVSIDLNHVASWFLGTALKPEDQFLAEIISGPFDADKLDYFERDCYYTGIRAEIDIERILAVVEIRDRADGNRGLVVRRAGVHHLEQIIFNKMLLFASVYHHHKIRALECAVRAVFRKIWADPSAITNPRLRFPTIESMLTITDEEFWVLAAQEPQLKPYVDALAFRREPPMRALAVSLPAIWKDPDESKEEADARQYRYVHLATQPDQQRHIGDTLFERLPTADQSLPFGVWFDMPENPPVSAEAKETWVARGDELVPLTKFFPTDEWVAAYTDNKLTAHVFFDPPEAPRRRVAKLARDYLESTYGLVCLDWAEEMCFKE